MAVNPSLKFFTALATDAVVFGVLDWIVTVLCPLSTTPLATLKPLLVNVVFNAFCHCRCLLSVMRFLLVFCVGFN